MAAGEDFLVLSPHTSPFINAQTANGCLQFTLKSHVPALRLVVSGRKGRKRHILLSPHFWVLAVCFHGAILDLWGCVSGEEIPILPVLGSYGDVSYFPVTPSLHFSAPFPRQGPPLPPHPPLDPTRDCVPPPRQSPTPPSAPRSFADAPGLPFLPPPVLLLSSLSGRSVILGVDMHAPGSPGRMGIVRLGGALLPREGKAATSSHFDLQTITA